MTYKSVTMKFCQHLQRCHAFKTSVPVIHQAIHFSFNRL